MAQRLIYRSAGYAVVEGLPGQQGSAQSMGCDQQLSDHAGAWQLDDIQN